MARHTVAAFQPYPFELGDKLTITSGPRAGDWEIIGTSERKLTLRCPVSGREFEWDRFCYLVQTKENEEWPHRD